MWVDFGSLMVYLHITCKKESEAWKRGSLEVVMNKKVLPFLFAIPSLLLLLVLKIVPAVTSFAISVKNYSVIRGLKNSPTVGLENYVLLLKDEMFARSAMNTARLSLLSILATCVFATLLILLISLMPNRIVKTAALLIIAIPAFIPPVSYAGVFLRALSLSTGSLQSLITSLGMEPILFLADGSYLSLVFAVMDALRSVFVPVVIGVLACENEGARFGRILTVILVYALIRVTWFMSPDTENLMMISNPLNLAKGEVFDTGIYKMGLAHARFSSASAMWVIKAAVQLVLNLAVFFCADRLLPKLKGIANTLSEKVGKGSASVLSVFGYLFFALGSIGIIGAVFLPATKRFSGGTGVFEGIRMLLSDGMFVSSFFRTLLCCIIGSVLYAFFTLTMAMPMLAKTKVYPLLLIIIMSISNNMIGEFLFYRFLGMHNTVYPVILSSISVSGAFALYFIVSNRLDEQSAGLTDYLKAAALPLLALTVLHFIGAWGGFLYDTIFIFNKELFGVGMLGRELFSQTVVMRQEAISAEAVKAAYILLSSIVPVVLGSLLICLNRIFPMTVFGALSRRTQ